MVKSLKKAIAVGLSALMVACAMPFTALAAAGDYNPDIQIQFNMVAANGDNLHDFEEEPEAAWYTTGSVDSAEKYASKTNTASFTDWSGLNGPMLKATGKGEDGVYKVSALTLKAADTKAVAEAYEIEPLAADHTYGVGDLIAVTVKAKNCNKIQWIANGNIFASKEVQQSADETVYVIDLDTIEGAEDFLYIRCELFGEGGLTLSQALVIDNGTEPLTYTPDTSTKAKFQSFWNRIKSLRIFVLFEIIIDNIIH